MKVTHEQLVDMLRGIHSRAGGTAAVLNLLRAGEVRGGSDVLLLSEMVVDPRMRVDLAHHAMDEARHAFILLRRMQELGANPSRVPHELDRLELLTERSRIRDFRQVYANRGSVGDAEMMEFMTVALIPEHDAVTKLRANWDALASDPKTQALIGSILRDEERHITYLSGWLDHFGERFSRRAVVAARERLEAIYEELDGIYYGSLQGYLEHAAA
jgi:bacterioferritin (cytochrome b1)